MTNNDATHENKMKAIHESIAAYRIKAIDDLNKQVSEEGDDENLAFWDISRNDFDQIVAIMKHEIEHHLTFESPYGQTLLHSAMNAYSYSRKQPVRYGLTVRDRVLVGAEYYIKNEWDDEADIVETAKVINMFTSPAIMRCDNHIH